MQDNGVWYGVGLTERGLVRPTNQDALLVDNSLGIWIVADGMGGHAGGEVASRLAVESVASHLQAESARRIQEGVTPHTHEASVRDAIRNADHAILSHAKTEPGLKGMGTTIVLLRISSEQEPRATIAHVGDSRAYRFSQGSLTLLTQDHSLVEDYVRCGRLTPAQASKHPLRHVITRALGIEGSSEPDISVYSLAPADLVLLCTDGLTKMLDDARIAATLRASGGSPEAACRALVDAAITRGGEDNVTVLICAAPI